METNLILQTLYPDLIDQHIDLIKRWVEIFGQYDQRFRSFFDQLDAAITAIALNLTSFLLRIARVSYVVTAIIGLLFWASHYNRRTGAEMIVGSVILAVAAEAILPTIVV